MWVTDSGIVSKTSWREFSKAASKILVTLEGIVTAKHPGVRMSCLVSASTSFLVYVTVTRDSAPKSPAASSVSASSMIELSRSSSTLRTLRWIGSWQGCFSRSIAFNSRTVAVITTSRVMTPPCKVFNWTSHDMAQDNWRSGHGQRIAPFIRVVLWMFKTYEPSKAKSDLVCAVFTLALVTIWKARLEIYAYSEIWVMGWYVALDCPLLSTSFMAPSCVLGSKTISSKHVQKHLSTKELSHNFGTQNWSYVYVPIVSIDGR